MKKLLSLLVKTVFCVVALLVGVYIANTVVDMADPWKDKTPEKLTDIGSPYKFYYDTLDDVGKHVYNEIITNVYDMPDKIRIPAVSEGELRLVFAALLADNPDLFFIGRKCTLISQGIYTYCAMEYYIDAETCSKQKAELEKVCRDIISSLSDPDDEFLTELEIHDRIINNCKYRLEDDELVYCSSYGALINGEAGCEGYSKAAKLLFDMAGIESALVSGISTPEKSEQSNHMWNVVKINGDFYHLDCTWDDPVSKKGKDMLTYNYFNLNDEMIAKTHVEKSYDFDCTATAENYFIKTDSYFETYSRDDENRIGKVITDKINQGIREVYLSFGSKEAYGDAVSDLLDSGRIYSVLRNVKTKTKISTDSISCLPDPERRVLTLVIDE